jgi:hypothetical protein
LGVLPPCALPFSAACCAIIDSNDTMMKDLTPGFLNEKWDLTLDPHHDP